MSEERMKPLNIRQTIYTLNPLQVEPEPPVPTVTPIPPPVAQNDYGLRLITRLSDAPSLYDPNLAALDKQSAPKVEKKE